MTVPSYSVPQAPPSARSVRPRHWAEGMTMLQEDAAVQAAKHLAPRVPEWKLRSAVRDIELRGKIVAPKLQDILMGFGPAMVTLASRRMKSGLSLKG